MGFPLIHMVFFIYPEMSRFESGTILLVLFILFIILEFRTQCVLFYLQKSNSYCRSVGKVRDSDATEDCISLIPLIDETTNEDEVMLLP